MGVESAELAPESPDKISAKSSSPLALSNTSAGAQSVPDAALARIGTQYANSLTTEDIKRMAEFGFKSVRFVMYVEKDLWSRYDPLVQEIWARGLTPIVIPFTTGVMDDANHRKSMIAGLARAAARYRDGDMIWDAWNEPTSPVFWKNRATPQVFATWANDVINAVRAFAPRHKVMLPSIQRTDREGNNFLMAMLAAQPDLLARADYIAVHTYGPATGGGPHDPESKTAQVVNLRNQIARRFKRTPVMVVSEFGWHTTGGGSVAPGVAGAYAPRFVLGNIAAGIPMTIYYEWRDEASEIGRSEPGIQTIDYRPRPAYHQLQAMFRELKDHRFVKTLQNGSTRVLLFNDPSGSAKIAAWNTRGGARNVTITSRNRRRLTLPRVSQNVQYFPVPAGFVF
jgi:hypothetical protein